MCDVESLKSTSGPSSTCIKLESALPYVAIVGTCRDVSPKLIQVVEESAPGSMVQGQLKNVRQIISSARAFAAILEDRSVVTWGDPENGGDCSAVRDRLRLGGMNGVFKAITVFFRRERFIIFSRLFRHVEAT